MADDTDKAEPSAPTCLADPNFAVICSFLDRFAAQIGIPVLPFTQLQEMLEDQDQVSQALTDLLVKLLRKARKSFTLDKWEKALTRFAHGYSQQDGWELERFGYKKASLGVKLRLLKTLLEAQFDINTKFKNDVNKLTPQELRVEPLGRDQEGLVYWCQFDPACNVRVYREDIDEESWDLVAQDRAGLVKLIDGLSSGEGQQTLDMILEEEAALEAEKPVTDTGQDDEIEGEDVEDEEEGEDDEEDEEDGDEESGDEGEDDLEKPKEGETEENEDDSAEEKPEKKSKKEKDTGAEATNGNAEKPVEHDLQARTKEREIPANLPEKKPQIITSDEPKPDQMKVEESKVKVDESDVKVGNSEEKAGQKSIVLPVPLTSFSASKTITRAKDVAVRNGTNSKQPVSTNESLDLSARPLPPKPTHRPGSRLEEIFKMKMDRPVNPYPEDKTSILSQMAARFNCPEEAAEDLSAPSKKPRLDDSVKNKAPPNDTIVGEAIEENVMVVRGEGSGADCNAGNPLADYDPKTNPDLEVVGIFNASSEESVREALRACILEDAASNKSTKTSGVSYKSDKTNIVTSHCSQKYTDSEINLLHRIRLINSSIGEKSMDSDDSDSNLCPSVPQESSDFVFEASETIEEEILYFSGCGAGHDCDTGNPNEPSSEKPSTSEGNQEPEKKPKKLWSIETICKPNDDSKSETKRKLEDSKENGPNSDVPCDLSDVNSVDVNNVNEAVLDESLKRTSVSDPSESKSGIENGQNDSGDAKEKTPASPKKSVFLSNLIEHCLVNKAENKAGAGEEPPAGDKYEDLFSAKNILGPSKSEMSADSSAIDNMLEAKLAAEKLEVPSVMSAKSAEPITSEETTGVKKLANPLPSEKETKVEKSEVHITSEKPVAVKKSVDIMSLKTPSEAKKSEDAVTSEKPPEVKKSANPITSKVQIEAKKSEGPITSEEPTKVEKSANPITSKIQIEAKISEDPITSEEPIKVEKSANPITSKIQIEAKKSEDPTTLKKLTEVKELANPIASETPIETKILANPITSNMQIEAKKSEGPVTLKKLTDVKKLDEPLTSEKPTEPDKSQHTGNDPTAADKTVTIEDSMKDYIIKKGKREKSEGLSIDLSVKKVDEMLVSKTECSTKGSSEVNETKIPNSECESKEKIVDKETRVLKDSELPVSKGSDIVAGIHIKAVFGETVSTRIGADPKEKVLAEEKTCIKPPGVTVVDSKEPKDDSFKKVAPPDLLKDKASEKTTSRYVQNQASGVAATVESKVSVDDPPKNDLSPKISKDEAIKETVPDTVEQPAADPSANNNDKPQKVTSSLVVEKSTLSDAGKEANVSSGKSSVELKAELTTTSGDVTKQTGPKSNSPKSTVEQKKDISAEAEKEPTSGDVAKQSADDSATADSKKIAPQEAGEKTNNVPQISKNVEESLVKKTEPVDKPVDSDKMKIELAEQKKKPKPEALSKTDITSKPGEIKELEVVDRKVDERKPETKSGTEIENKKLVLEKPAEKTVDNKLPKLTVESSSKSKDKQGVEECTEKLMSLNENIIEKKLSGEGERVLEPRDQKVMGIEKCQKVDREPAEQESKSSGDGGTDMIVKTEEKAVVGPLDTKKTRTKPRIGPKSKMKEWAKSTEKSSGNWLMQMQGMVDSIEKCKPDKKEQPEPNVVTEEPVSDVKTEPESETKNAAKVAKEVVKEQLAKVASENVSVAASVKKEAVLHKSSEEATKSTEKVSKEIEGIVVKCEEKGESESPEEHKTDSEKPTEKPKGGKSRTNSLNTEDEVPSKVRKTVEEKEPSKETVSRRASRRSSRAASLTKPSEVEVKKVVDKEVKKEPIDEETPAKKVFSLSTFSLEEPLEDLTPKTPLAKVPKVPQVIPPSKGGKRKRGSQAAGKLEEEGTEEDESNLEQEDIEVGGKKPRLKGKLKRGGKRKKGKGGFRGRKESVSDQDSKLDDDKSKTAKEEEEAEESSKVEGKENDKKEDRKCKDENKSDDDIPLAKRGRGRGKAETETPKTDPKEEKPPKSQRRPKKQTLLGLTEADLKSVSDTTDTPIGMRTSRRIAMQKIKEEAEKQAIEKAIKQIEKGDKKKKKDTKGNKEVSHSSKKDKTKETPAKGKRKTKHDTDEDEDEEPPIQDEKKDGKFRKKKKDLTKFNLKKYNTGNPWRSSSDDEDENLEEEEEDHLEFMGMEDDEVVGKEMSDHEFSCDEDLEKDGDSEYLPVKRARTAVRKEKSEKKEEDEADEEDMEDYKCEKCGVGDHPEWILLCDTCDKGYHASCLRPPLMLIPEGDWFCPICSHASLVNKLKDVLRTFERNTKKRDNEELRRKRLAYVGISLANVLPDSVGNKVKKEKTHKKRPDHDDDRSSSEDSGSSRSSSGDSRSESTEDSDEEPIYQLRQRRSAAQNYRFNDYDQLIDSAIQDEMVAAGTAPPSAAEAPSVSNAESVDCGAAVVGQEGASVPAENGEVPETKEGAGEGDEEEGKKVKRGEEEDADISKGWRPPVVPRRPPPTFTGRRKPKKLCNLDVESDDQNDSDEDFKGSDSDEEEEDFSDASEESGFHRRNRQPLRRSGRARRSRVDRDFINDDSDDDDDGPKSKKKKKKQEWDESESTESDQSWGRRKKRAATRSSFSKAKSRSKKKKKSKRYDSDSDAPKKKSKPKKPRVRYGLSEDDDDDEPLIKTRGKKINYTEFHGSDTEEEERLNRIKGRKTLSDMEAEDEEFVLDKDEEEEFMGGHSQFRKAPRRISSGDDSEEDGTKAAKSDDKLGEVKPKEKTDAVKTTPVKSTPGEKPKPADKKIDETKSPAKSLPPASQHLPASKPKSGPLSKKPQRIESDEEAEEEEEDEEEELEDEQEPEEEEEDGDADDNEGEEEEEEESEEEKMPIRQIPPPVPSLKARIPGRNPPALPPVGLPSMQSKLKEALSAGASAVTPSITLSPVRPKESEALTRLREKLAASAVRPPTVANPVPPVAISSVPPRNLPAPGASPLEPGALSSPVKIKQEEEEKPVTPPPHAPGSIRVVNTAKLLAQPVQEQMKRIGPPESVIRGMLGGPMPPGGPHGPPPMFYNRPSGPPPRGLPPGMDPGRFMQRPPLHPAAAAAHHLQHQQRRFPDRFMYGPGGGFGGGYYPPAPYPPQEVRPVPVPADYEPPMAPDDEPPTYAPASAPPDGPGEFGGLVSYFSSQREEEAELDT